MKIQKFVVTSAWSTPVEFTTKEKALEHAEKIIGNGELPEDVSVYQFSNKFKPVGKYTLKKQ